MSEFASVMINFAQHYFFVAAVTVIAAQCQQYAGFYVILKQQVLSKGEVVGSPSPPSQLQPVSW